MIQFEKDKLTLRVPTSKLQSVGMRKLAEEPVVKKAMETLKGKARIKRTMWSRRAQEYEAKINSGDLIAIAEVVRDLYRSEAQPEQSYSERQLYELALDRMAREIAAVDKLDERGAMQRITEVLAKSARAMSRAAEDEAGDAEAERLDSHLLSLHRASIRSSNIYLAPGDMFAGVFRPEMAPPQPDRGGRSEPAAPRAARSAPRRGSRSRARLRRSPSPAPARRDPRVPPELCLAAGPSPGCAPT